MFEIEKDIPIRGWGRAKKYPFDNMEIDDSFLVPTDNDKGQARKVIISIQGAARNRRKSQNHNRRFTCRRVEGGVRCWRVE